MGGDQETFWNFSGKYDRVLGHFSNKWDIKENLYFDWLNNRQNLKLRIALLKTMFVRVVIPYKCVSLFPFVYLCLFIYCFVVQYLFISEILAQGSWCMTGRTLVTSMRSVVDIFTDAVGNKRQLF